MENEVSVALVGPSGSGKTQFAELLYLTFADLTSKGKLEGTLNIPITINLIELVDDLINRGLGPRRTLPAKEAAKAYLQIRFRTSFFRRRSAKIPIADLSGETYRLLMSGILGKYFFTSEQLQSFLSSNGISNQEFKTITDLVLNSSVILLLANIEYIENLPSMPQETDRPDATLATFIASLVQYKQFNPDSPKLKGIAVVLTHYDGPSRDNLVARGFDFRVGSRREMALQKYVKERMITTYAQLRYVMKDMGVKVQYFYSGCEAELDANRKPVYDGERQKFEIDSSKHRPKYTPEEFERLTNWIKEILS